MEEPIGPRPRFSKTLSAIDIEPGDSATFECVLDEEVAANLKWLRNNVPFDDKLADRVIIASDSNVHKLTLKHCRTSDAGLITAHASNEFGATTSSAQFSIVEKPRESGNKPYFMLRLKDSDLMENTKAHYLVKVGGNPQPSVEFLKDGAPLKETDRVTITRRNDGIYHELFIDGVVPEDSGEYKCVAKNDAGTEECVANIAVVDEKNIWQGFENRVASPGEEPAFTWFRDGEKFEPSERFEVMFKDEEDTLALVFHNIKPEDAGMYTCMASTGSGRISCSAELTVEGAIKQVAKEPVPPLFTMDLTDTEVSMGGSAMLELKVTGHPKPKVTWYKGGEEVKAGGRYRFLYEDEESVALMIKKVEMGDAGKYTVVATNDFGEVTTEGSLFVRAPPRFKKKTSDMACMTDTPLKYEVEVEGTPAPQLKWYKDGQMIIESERVKFVQESEDKFALVIERMTLEDSGSYSVVAENEMGQISDFFKVIASSPPEFIKQMLKEIETTEGDEITFEVKIKGSPDPNVRWELDGKELKHDGTHIIMEQDGNRHLLHMKGVTRLDAGKVSCVISNEFGTQEDKSQHWVRHKPQFLKKVSDIECCEGDAHVEVTCEISARPEPDITWYYEETEIVETSKHFRKVVEGSTYKITILHVDEECMGKFTCKASNKLGSAESSGYLQVLCEPKVKDGLNDAMIDENQNAEFTCLLSGVPTPDITWYKDKVEITHEIEERITITKEGDDRYTLKLKGAVGTDAGFYEIRATNKLGATASKGKLIVNTKPVIVTKSLDTEGIETEEIVLEVKAEGIPRPSIRWYIGDMEIEETYRIKKFEDESDNTYQLRIAALKPEDAGEYECVVENMLGEARLKGKVTVKTLKELRQPKIMANLIDQTVMKGESVRLLASIRGEPTPEVHWFKDGKVANETDGVEILKCEDGFTYQISIEKATEKHHGLYEVMAKNEHGQAESQATVTVLIKPEIYDMPNVEVDHSSDITVHATVVANPKPKTKWLKDGEEYQFTERVRSYEEATDSYTLVVKQYIDVVKAESKDGGVYTIIAENEHGKMEQSFKLHINESKPTVLVPVTDVEIGVGDTATLHGKITGIPKPNLSWLKDGQPVEYSDLIVARDGEDQAVELYFKEIVKEDFAMYTLKGENLFGVVESTAELSLPKSPPRILEELQPRIKVKEGEPMVLQMKFDKLSGAEVKWYKDGHPIIPDGRIRIESLPDGTQKLIIDETISDDTGEYKVAAINNAGHTTSDCHAEVRPNYITPASDMKPKILTGLEDVDIHEGKPLKLGVQVQAWPPADVTWTHNGAKVRQGQNVMLTNDQDGNYFLEILRTKETDEGKYTFTAKNPLGDAATTGTVKVLPRISAPKVVRPLRYRQIQEGQYLKLDAAFSGNPTPTPTWLKDGEAFVPDGMRVSCGVDPSGVASLQFHDVRSSDRGEYSLVAKNSAGECSTDAKLDVTDLPGKAPYVMRAPEVIEAVEGRELKLILPVGGSPFPDASWNKNGHPLISPDGRINIINRNGEVGVHIKEMQPSDVGEYECLLTNHYGKQLVKVQVKMRDSKQPPKFTQPMKDKDTVLGNDASFQVKFEGEPEPEIDWYFGTEPVRRSRKRDISKIGNSATLTIRNCEESDIGRYSCVASNSAGEDRCSARLGVLPESDENRSPSFLRRPIGQKITGGSPLRLSACIDGKPEPDFQWYFNGDPIYPSDRITVDRGSSGLVELNIKDCTENDAGVYKLRIFNSSGEASASATIHYDHTYDLYRKRTIEDAPLPLAEKPIISKMTDRRLVLSWNPYIPQPIFGPRAPPVTYVVEMADFPGEEWHTVQRGIRGCACEIKNLEPFKDYKFRIRCENRYGMSEPSPFAVASRSKIRPDPPTFKHYLDPGVKFRPDSSPYFPKDFDIERPPHDQLAAAPRFLRQQDEVQYGVKGHPANIRWFVYGYPKPVVHWFFNGQPIEEGGRFTSTYTRNGCATLIMNSMLERDVGLYECVATNEHGTARQKQHVELADHPRVVEHLKETTTMLTKTVKLECQITGVPYPDIKWYKDWQPLCPTSRIKIMWNEPDRCTLIIQDLIRKDEGLYSCSASNLAGSVSTSCMMHVVDDDNIYNWRNYSFPRKVPIRPKSIYDLYDIGDELGRGTQGVTYHAVERSTGRNYAAKIMHGRGHLKDYMKEEYEIMNLLNSPYCTRLVDAFETEDTFALVMELNGGGELMDSVLKQPLATEREIADYIRQVLWGLEHMHDNDIAHLGLTPGDILITRKGGVELRVSDFGLAKRVLDGPVQQRYGNPEYSAPETVLGERSGTSADMWSIGIITYLLLSGISPFRGRDDAETMDKIKSKLISYEGGVFDSLSADAKDFLQKLLRWESEDRLSCKDALKHPWFHPSTRSDVSLKTDSLREYIVHYRDWYANASCRTWFRRRPLEGAYTDPSRMVYPPGMNYTPLSTPERTIMPKRSLPAGDGRITDLIEYDQEIPDSHSMYQNGPDTYLLQLRDVDFPSRLRRYMQVASSRSPTFALKLRQDPWIGSVTVKERRRFQDLNDEEIDDERRQQKLRGPGISVSSASSVIPRRIRLEVGCGMGDLKRESEVFREQKWEGQMPFFREKLQTTSLADDSHADLTCLAVGDPKPIIQWFKNDMVIISGRRVTIEEDDEGRSFLRFRPANKEDTGVYKVVARNKFGQTVCKGRLLVAHRPGVMESPSVGEISDTEIVLKWDLPTDDGNSPIICYGLEYREADQIEWTEVAMNIDHEFFCMRNLQPLTSYEFRLYAQNAFGRSPPGLTSSVLTTKAEGAPKVKVTRAMKHLQLLTDRGFELDEELLKRPPLDYTIEDNPIPFTPGNPKEKYHFIAEMDRGRFSTIVKAFEPETEQFFVAKLISTEGLDRSEWAQREYFHLSRLQHERMAILHEAYRMDKGLVLMLDKLQGYDVLTFLAQKPEYSEELVANIIKQLFDAVQYLHWKDLVHLDIQPDNIVMASIRKLDVRLVDFGCSQQVTRKGLPVETLGNLEYMAPEVIGKEDITPQADVWSIGVVAYILLSGISPFRGATDAETTANINFARYRFEHLYREITQEASRFLMLLFKRHAVKRPTVEECLEHRWLQCTDYMIKKRERAVFNTKAIRDFSDNYHTERDRRAGNVGDELLQMVGLGRSEEVAFDTTTTF